MFLSTDIVSSPEFDTARSILPSPSKSPIDTLFDFCAVETPVVTTNDGDEEKLIDPVEEPFKKKDTVPPVNALTARSGLLSPSKLPIDTPHALPPEPPEGLKAGASCIKLMAPTEDVLRTRYTSPSAYETTKSGLPSASKSPTVIRSVLPAPLMAKDCCAPKLTVPDTD